MIKGKQIAVNNQLVDVPSFMVTVENENKINLQPNTAINGGRPGRRLRKKQANNWILIWSMMITESIFCILKLNFNNLFQFLILWF